MLLDTPYPLGSFFFPLLFDAPCTSPSYFLTARPHVGPGDEQVCVRPELGRVEGQAR